jgi:hypothetical protein
MTEMLDWLESNNPCNFRGLDLLPYVRIEDHVEDDTFVRTGLPGINSLLPRTAPVGEPAGRDCLLHGRARPGQGHGNCAPRAYQDHSRSLGIRQCCIRR